MQQGQSIGPFEWKVVRDAASLGQKVKEGRSQCASYSAGLLAGFELTSRRYVVLVSEGVLDMPPAESDGSVTFEYVNIPVRPAPHL